MVMKGGGGVVEEQQQQNCYYFNENKGRFCAIDNIYFRINVCGFEKAKYNDNFRTFVVI